MNGIDTPYGILKPQYEDDGVRRKYKEPVTYYETGELESIVLQQQTLIETTVGKIPAEQISFYPSGNIKRIFPLNGKITGYWTEEDEYGLAVDMSFSFPHGEINGKVIGIYFYDGGGIKSITLWPDQRQRLFTGLGEITGRIGISFYPDGSLRSCEPAKSTLINTPIGEFRAFDPTALGVNGDRNSLEFDEKGSISALVTSLNRVEILNTQGKTLVLEPLMKPNLFNPEVMDLIPLRIAFQENQVLIGHKGVGYHKLYQSFSLDACKFTIQPYEWPIGIQCSACANCTACG